MRGTNIVDYWVVPFNGGSWRDVQFGKLLGKGGVRDDEFGAFLNVVISCLVIGAAAARVGSGGGFDELWHDTLDVNVRGVEANLNPF